MATHLNTIVPYHEDRGRKLWGISNISSRAGGKSINKNNSENISHKYIEYK